MAPDEGRLGIVRSLPGPLPTYRTVGANCYPHKVRGLLLAVLVGLATSQLALFCTTIFLHRALAHRALSLRPFARWVFRLLIWLMTGIRPRQWVAVHRKHHAFTDLEGDPHSPALVGFWRVEPPRTPSSTGEWRGDGVTVQRYAKDLPPDRWDTLLFDHAFLGLGIGIGGLCALLGWRLGLVAAAVHAVSYLALERGHQCRRAHLRIEELCEHRLQQPMARLPHRRRGPPQQPPRGADLREAGTRPPRARSGLVGDPAHGSWRGGLCEAGGGSFRVEAVRSHVAVTLIRRLT